MEDWHSYKKQIEIKGERDTHPFSNGLMADTFTSVSFESTEIEYLDFLYSLIIACNVTHILETGTHKGISTVALGYALKRNLKRISIDEVKLISIEIIPEFANEARERVKTCGLSDIVTIIEDDTIHYLENQNYDSIYDFVYFDSSRPIRPKEFDILQNRKLIKDSSLLVFHDTCLTAIKSDPKDKEIQKTYIKNLERISSQCKHGIILPFSRGLSIFQY
jgi:predicted O-methyltransferase YrrM